MSCNCDCRIGFGFVVTTNGVIVNGVNAVYGVNPARWRDLPNEGVALLKIRQAVPAPGAALPVAIAVPSRSTVTTVGDSSGCCGTITDIVIVDPAGDTFTGAEIVNNTEHLIYFNKCAGIIRMLDCCRAVVPAEAPVV